MPSVDLKRSALQVQLAVLLAALFAIAVLAGCGADSRSAAATAEHEGTGVIESFDAREGTLDIAHEPIPSANLPATVTGFKLADPQGATLLSLKQRVEFKFTHTSDGERVITEILAVPARTAAAD